MLLQHRDGGDTEEPGREPGNGFPPTLLGGNAPYPPGVSSALSHRPQLSPAAPGGGCSGLHPIPSAVLCSLAFLPRGRRQTGASPSAPLGPFCRPSPQPHPSWDFPLWLSGGEMGKIPSAVFPSSQQPQEQQVAEDAWTPRGCLAQSSFASNCTQALRFLPCRGAFGMQPLHPLQLQGCTTEPMDGRWSGNPRAQQPRTPGSLLSTSAPCCFLPRQICHALQSPRAASLQNPGDTHSRDWVAGKHCSTAPQPQACSP